MKLRLLTLACLCAALTPAALADDFGMGLELNAEKSLTKQWDIEAGGELRTQNTLSDIERWSIGLGTAYRLLKTKQWQMKADLGYQLMARRILAENTKKYHYPAYWSPRHRAYASLSAGWKVSKRLELSLRERYQFTRRQTCNLERFYISDPTHRADDKVKDAESESLLRSRLQLKVNTRKKCPWTPYLSVEWLNDLSDAFSLDQTRYIVGTDYKLNKHNSLGVSYRYKDKSNSEEAKGHLLTISYSYDF
ncbi:MAG: DUF2490 domain-containing protein [Bacteroidales bacterium]|nr:DUF2490 domain-containing protein [Candidatus Liminaster caballi]